MRFDTCALALGDNWQGIINIAYYSHIIPVILALFLGIYVVLKTKFSKLSTIFLGFSVCFSLWLIGDLIAWVSPNYFLVYFTWSWLDYVNIAFFVFGTYFFGVLARGRISVLEKVILIGVSIPAFVLAFTGNSVVEFYQPVCEAVVNNSITFYKLFAESVFVLLIIFSLVSVWRKSDRAKKIQLSVVAIATLFFFAVFSSTEYIATITNIYEINLYGLFVLPIFLIIMVFAITNLGVFKIRFIGTQLLVYTLIIMVGSQFLFLQNSTDAALNVITLVITISFGLVLLRNTKKELEARIQIETLAHDLEAVNVRLKELDKQKTEFVSFASHQLRGPLTAIKGYASLILEGDYGSITDDLRSSIKIIFDSTKTLATVVDDYLNVSRIELGEMKYSFSVFDLKELVSGALDELKPNIEKAGLKLEFNFNPGDEYMVRADEEKFKQVILNLVDNSVKYTPKGKIAISVENIKGKIRISIKDTGIGISKEVISKLFSKFKRADNASKTNMRGTGLGLFIAKEIVTAHGGNIWVESEGEGKGSAFIVELDSVKNV